MPRYFPGSGLRSPTDKDDLTNQWKRARVTNDSTFGLASAVQRHERWIAKLRRRIITPPIGSSLASSATGETTPFELYPSVQHVFPNPTNDLVTFQYRGGYVGYRSAWFQSPYTESNPLAFLSNLQGNYETAIYCDGSDANPFADATTYNPPPLGADFTKPPKQNKGGNIEIVIGSATLVTSVNQPGGDAGVAGTQVVLNLNSLSIPQLSSQVIGAAFWIEITDTAVLAGVPTAQIYGQIFTDVRAAFPAASPSIIPLGVIWPSVPYPIILYSANPSSFVAGSTPLFFPINFYDHHLVNRFPVSNSTNFSVNPTNYRGAWTADSLSGQSFFPGDMVLDDTTTSSTTAGGRTLTWQDIYICKKFSQTQSNPPSNAGLTAYWQKQTPYSPSITMT